MEQKTMRMETKEEHLKAVCYHHAPAAALGRKTR